MAALKGTGFFLLLPSLMETNTKVLLHVSVEENVCQHAISNPATKAPLDWDLDRQAFD